ncbi:hypothetical protein Glove_217g17 [Diversispora epigaea]|uniref:BTB domain-containing protein n=1 Tax=Diversispora epigaea TaxID=1348612 RepID=A0A397ILK0_9GLOM|nr:hypothetical protein Glove_217g17 [Diversispora epigaea]
MTFNFLEKLSEDFSDLLNDKEEYNVLIEVDKEQDQKIFTAHSSILRYRSPYFNRKLSNTIPNDDNNKIITKPNISAHVFEIILKYIYGGIIETEFMDIKIMFKLMIAANELEFRELSVKLENHFIESKDSWLRTNFAFVYHSIFENNEFKKLENFCNDIIIKHPSIVFESTEFTTLQEPALVSILRRDDLRIQESEIWDYVIKWGVTQNPTLPVNLEDWSDENFTTLKTTLQQCLPLVRYFHISNSDVMNKVKPYKKILDKQIWNDLKQHFILPDQPISSVILPPRLSSPPQNTQEEQVFEPFPTIINQEHTTMFAYWLDQETNYPSGDNPYEFQLLLRGIEDGFSPRTFWNICDGHENTIVIAKVNGTNEIIGGYNPLAWDKSKRGWMKTSKSFIFSFPDGNIQNSILSRVKNKSHALSYPSEKDKYGPIFGNNEFTMGSDVYNFAQDKQNRCDSAYRYEKSIRATNDRFSIIDYEVFKIVRKST